MREGGFIQILFAWIIQYRIIISESDRKFVYGNIQIFQIASPQMVYVVYQYNATKKSEPIDLIYYAQTFYRKSSS